MEERVVKNRTAAKRKFVYSKFKILHDLELSNSLREGKAFAPKSVRLDLTTNCNHNCYYCLYESVSDGLKGVSLNSNFPKNQNIDTARVIRLITELEETGVKALTLTGGGEPTLHPDFRQIFERILSGTMDVGIITNGTKAGLLSAYKKSIRFKWARISVDASNEITWKKVHDPKDKRQSFGRLKETIRQLCYDKSEDLMVGLGFVICQENYAEVYDFIKMAKEIGVDNVRVGILYGHGFEERHRAYLSKARHLISKAIHDFEDAFFRIFDKTKRYDNLSLKFKDYDDCKFQDISASIGADLRLYPCCFTKYSPQYAMGFLGDKSFADAWFNERTAFRKKFDLNACPPCWYDENNRILEYLSLKNPPHVNFID